MKKLLNIFFIFALIFFCSIINAQDSANTNDETINSKVNIEEKIPEDFKKLIENSDAEIKNTQNIDSLKNDSEHFESTVSGDKKTEEQQSTEVQKNINIDEIKLDKIPMYPLSNNEKIVSWVIFSGLLLSNFIVYIFFPKLKSLLVATPLNIGGISAEGSKWKRNSLELILLILLFLLYAGSVVNKNYSEENILIIAEKCFIYFLVLQFSYIAIRLLIGFNTRCPKCKVTFSRKLINSRKEPRSTYQTRGESPGSRNKVMETGIITKDFICISCNHEWSKTSSYKDQVGSI